MLRNAARMVTAATVPIVDGAVVVIDVTDITGKSQNSSKTDGVSVRVDMLTPFS